MTASEPAPDDLLTIPEIAPLVGLTEKSTATTHHRADKRRREGRSLWSDMPAPDKIFGRTPAWRRDTIERWKERRG